MKKTLVSNVTKKLELYSFNLHCQPFATTPDSPNRTPRFWVGLCDQAQKCLSCDRNRKSSQVTRVNVGKTWLYHMTNILAFWLVLTYDLLEARRIDDVINIVFFFPYYINQIESMLPRVCSGIDHRGRQYVVRTSVTHSAIASSVTFFVLTTFWRHLRSVTEQMHCGIYLLKWHIPIPTQ